MIDLITIGNNQIEKHFKYKEKYKPNSIFWGLGLEHELYLEFENKKSFTVDEFISNHKRERYSVDYYSNYKKDQIDRLFLLIKSNLIKDKNIKRGGIKIKIPVLLNAHSFSKTDMFNNSKTLYSKNQEPNPKFIGKTLIEFLEEQNEYFKNNDNWLFDGDTIEFINCNFYNIKLNKVFEEINFHKKKFINLLNNIFISNEIYKEYGKIKFMDLNHPFATHMTNINNISMFNNGTLHFNITLPTKLDSNSKIESKEKFINTHKKYIKLIQWIEPILIGTFGSPDPFSSLEYSDQKKFSSASQRNAVSRYIGLGTYDTDLMEPGKILTKPIDVLSVGKLDYWWYKRFHDNSAYNKLDQIGLDINFNKHWNHGIEIRFFDHIQEQEQIHDCFEFLIYLGDIILNSESDESNKNDNKTNSDYINPIIDKNWNDLMYKIMIMGKSYELTNKEIKMYENIFELKLKEKFVSKIFYEIFGGLKTKFNRIYKLISTTDSKYIVEPSGKFSSLTLNTVKLNYLMDFIGEFENINKIINEKDTEQNNSKEIISNDEIILENKKSCCTIS